MEKSKIANEHILLKKVMPIDQTFIFYVTQERTGVNQECLLLGKEILKIPLTRIMNSSIDTVVFPNE